MLETIQSNESCTLLDKYWGSKNGQSYKYGPYSSIEEAIKCTAYETGISPNASLWIAQECSYGIVNNIPDTLSMVMNSFSDRHIPENVHGRKCPAFIPSDQIENLRENMQQTYASWLHAFGYGPMSTTLVNKTKVTISHEKNI